MKKHTKFLTAAFFALAVILGLIACSSPTNPPPTTIQKGTSFSISGTFERDPVPGTDESGLQTVRFNLTDEASYSKAAVTANSYAVRGELEDGDIVYRLKGTYDPDNLNYSVSADSTHIRYAISGLVDSEGKSAGSTATLLVKTDPADPDTWTAHTFVIDEPAEELEIDTSEIVEDTDDEFPPEALGTWKGSEYTPPQYGYPGITENYQLLVNGWNINFNYSMRYGDEMGYSQERKMLIVEFEDKGGGVYDVIVAYPVYETSAYDEGQIIIAFLASKGIAGVEVLTSEPNLENYPGGPAFYINKEEGYSSWYNFTENQWSIVDAYFFTNHLEKVLIERGVKPTTLFEKGKAVFTNGNNKMEYTYYGEEKEDMMYNPDTGAFEPYTYVDYVECDTASKAKALEDLDTANSRTFTRQ